MGLRDDAIDKFKWAERNRVADWQRNADIGRPLFRAFREATNVVGGTGRDLRSPYDGDVDVNIDWHRSSALASMENDDLEMLVRLGQATEDGEITAAAYPLGKCRKCDRKVPLGPEPSSDMAEIGAALVAGTPVGHDCPK